MKKWNVSDVIFFVFASKFCDEQCTCSNCMQFCMEKDCGCHFLCIFIFGNWATLDFWLVWHCTVFDVWCLFLLLCGKFATVFLHSHQERKNKCAAFFTLTSLEIEILAKLGNTFTKCENNFSHKKRFTLFSWEKLVLHFTTASFSTLKDGFQSEGAQDKHDKRAEEVGRWWDERVTQRWCWKQFQFCYVFASNSTSTHISKNTIANSDSPKNLIKNHMVCQVCLFVFCLVVVVVSKKRGSLFYEYLTSRVATNHISRLGTPHDAAGKIFSLSNSVCFKWTTNLLNTTK